MKHPSCGSCGESLPDPKINKLILFLSSSSSGIFQSCQTYLHFERRKRRRRRRVAIPHFLITRRSNETASPLSPLTSCWGEKETRPKRGKVVTPLARLAPKNFDFFPKRDSSILTIQSFSHLRHATPTPNRKERRLFFFFPST